MKQMEILQLIRRHTSIRAKRAEITVIFPVINGNRPLSAQITVLFPVIQRRQGSRPLL
jgi:hypothetical protein